MSSDLSILNDAVILKGDKYDNAKLANRVLALYFSASWCGPCKAFTPTLIKAYNDAKAAGADFEVIFVSSDEDQEGFDEYYAKMPFAAVQFDKEDVREQLGSMFGVEGIPTLVVIGKDGKTITTGGKAEVANSKGDAFINWAK